MKGYPSWFSAGFISALLAVLFVSGILLIPNTFLRIEQELPFMLTGNYRISVTALHSILSYIIVAVLGALATHHVRLGWKLKRKRISGMLVFGTFILLTISGVAIYYIGDQDLSVIASFAHLFLGIIVPVFYVMHLLLRARTRL